MPFDSTSFDSVAVGARRSVPRNGRAPEVRIFRPSRSVMQAGRAHEKRWIIEFEPVSKSFIEPLMGWTGSQDPTAHLRLTFPSKDQAIAFANRQGWHYTVYEACPERCRLKSR